MERTATLRYVTGDTEWIAVVTRDELSFLLQVSQHGVGCEPRFQDAGRFTTGSACAKYVRSLAVRKFQGMKPAEDTLANIMGRTGKSVAPECYSQAPERSNEIGKGAAECVNCPYRTTCREPSEVDVTLAGGSQEDDTDFLERLQKKVVEKYMK